MPSRTECGLVGAWAANAPSDPFPLTSPLALTSLRALQHRGSDTWGLASVSCSLPEFVSTRVGEGKVPMQEDQQMTSMARLLGVLGHVRYATDGGKRSMLANAHPIAGGSCRGAFAVAFNGHIDGGSGIPGIAPGTADVHRVAAFLTDHPGLVWTAVLEDLLVKIPSAYSLVVLTTTGLWCVRDRYGYKPLVTAVLQDGDGVDRLSVVASEQGAIVALAKEARLQIRNIVPVGPGTTQWINGSGRSVLRPVSALAPLPRPKRCSLEAIYFMRPGARFDSLSVEDFRHRCGVALAHCDIAAGTDYPFASTIVVGCPKSGMLAGEGYALGSRLMYSQVLRLVDPSVRSFIQPTQEARQRTVRKKLRVVGSLAGKSVIVVDDSIVRGNSMREVVRMLREAGAEAVHVRVASPPVVNVCKWGVDIPDVEDLFAGAEAPSADRIGADSLRYLPRRELAVQTGGGWCRACFTSKEAGDS